MPLGSPGFSTPELLSSFQAPFHVDGNRGPCRENRAVGAMKQGRAFMDKETRHCISLLSQSGSLRGADGALRSVVGELPGSPALRLGPPVSSANTSFLMCLIDKM